MADVLSAPYVFEYAYKRSLGPVLSAFMTGLRDGVIVGAQTRDGRVLVPPAEYDESGEAVEGTVEVGSVGTVQTWCWVREPRPKHPLDRPFAWALIKLDGADTALLHAVDAGSPEAMSTGMRVRVRWADERVGRIEDIACFEVESEIGDRESEIGSRKPEIGSRKSESNQEPITRIKTPIRLDYTITAGRELSAFLEHLKNGRIVGRRSTNGKVYVPPVGACPMTGNLMIEDVEVADIGTLTTYCVINIPFEGQQLTPPYVCGWILLDGADVPLFHLVGDIDPAEVRMGMRVKAVWAEPADRTHSLISIRYFEATDEPDAPFDSYKEHL